MSNSLNILLVEDDISSCIELQNVAEDYKDINIVKVVDNSYDALSVFVNSSKNNSVATSIPNVVILDLELNNGGSGMHFLHALEELHLQTKPFILVTTNNESKIIHDNAEAHGADFFLYKSSPDYSPALVISFLNNVKNTILTSSQKFNDNQTTDEFKQLLISDLLSVGFSEKRKSFNFIIDAIVFYIQNPEDYIVQVAAKHKLKPNSVGKAISREIVHTWDTSCQSSKELYTGYVDPSRGVPTTMELISHYAQKYKCII